MRTFFNMFVMSMTFLCGSHLLSQVNQQEVQAYKQEYDKFLQAVRAKPAKVLNASTQIRKLAEGKVGKNMAWRYAVNAIIPRDEINSTIGKPTENDFVSKAEQLVAKLTPPEIFTQPPGGAPIAPAEEKVQAAVHMSDEEIEKKAAAGFSIYNKELLTGKDWIDLFNERSPYQDLAVIDENGTYYYFPPRELANELNVEGISARNPITNAPLNTLYAFSFDYSKPKEFPFTFVGQLTPTGSGRLRLSNWVEEYRKGGSLFKERVGRKDAERTAHITKKFVVEGGMDKQKDVISTTPFKVLIAEKFGLKYPKNNIPDWQKIKEHIQAALKQGKQGTYYLVVLPTTVTDKKTKKNYSESGEAFYFVDVSTLVKSLEKNRENPFNKQPIRNIYIYKFDSSKINEPFPFIWRRLMTVDEFLEKFGAPGPQPFQLGGTEQ